MSAAPEAVAGSQLSAKKDPTRRQMRSADLLGDARELLIEHAGEIYSLRQTSKGKLILTK